MTSLPKFAILACALCIVGCLDGAHAQKLPDRQVAFTIDDLRAASANSMNATTITEMTVKLLSTLRDKRPQRLDSSTRRSYIGLMTHQPKLL